MRTGIYRGRKVVLEKPIRTPGKSKEFKVYVKNPKTNNINVVRFGDKNLSLKSHIPARKKSYCARSKPLSKRGDKTSPNYWSRKRWQCRNP